MTDATSDSQGAQASNRAFEVTPPSVYAEEWARRARGLPTGPPSSVLSLAAGASVLVVVAHPDDETFGAGATLSSLVLAGVGVHVAALTSGEAALDHVGRTVSGLGALRRAEFGRACRALGVSSFRVLDLPDSGLAAHPKEVTSAVEELLDSNAPNHLLTVWWNDPHDDHQAVGRAALSVSRARGCRVSGFPIWAQHWTDPTRVLNKERFHLMCTDARARDQRRKATSCYRSQTEPLMADTAAVLPGSMLRWTTELLVWPA